MTTHDNLPALISLARAAQRLQVARRYGHGPSVDMLSDEMDAALVALGEG
jgi:hypothetical protein